MNITDLEVDELMALAYHNMKNDDLEGALDKAKRVLAMDNTPNEVYSFLGRLYATLGLFHRAKESFELYLKFVPDAFLELFQLGMVEKDLGNYEVSLETWERVLEISPQYDEAKYYMGDLLVQLERIEEARNYLLDLLETAEDESQYIPLADQLLNRIKGHH